MVAQLLRLRLATLANALRRSPVQILGMLVASAWGVGASAVLASQLVELRGSAADVARAVVVVGGSLIVAAFSLLPLAAGVDDALDPRRFALLGIKPTKVAVGLAIAACVSLPVVLVAIVAVAQITTWSRGPLPTLVAVAAAIIIVPTCVLCGRVSLVLASMLRTRRRARDAAGILLFAFLAALSISAAALATVDWQSQGLPVLRRVAAVAEWTPFGVAWAAPGDAAVGDATAAQIRLAAAVAFLVALCFIWRWLVGAQLGGATFDTSGARSLSLSTRGLVGLGWLGHLPGTAGGVIAARSLTYWGRDARYRVTLAIIPIVPVVMIAALLVGGLPVDFIMWIPVPVMCLFLGWMAHNDLALDSSSFWMHVSTHTPGVSDRWGRVVPGLVVGTPLVVIGSLVTVAVARDPGSLAGLIGLSACFLLSGLGIASVASAAAPYPAVHPGDSPFAQPQAVGATAAVVQSISFLSTIAVTSPVIWLVVMGVRDPDGDWSLIALGTGLAIGAVTLVCGILIGGRIVSRRGPELLAFALRN